MGPTAGNQGRSSGRKAGPDQGPKGAILMRIVECEACAKNADALVTVKVIPNDPQIPDISARFMLCWDHVADPGPIFGLRKPS